MINNIAKEKYYFLLQKEYFLLKILNFQFKGNVTYIDSLDKSQLYSNLISYSHDTNYLNKAHFSFFKGRNKSSDEDILFFEEKDTIITLCRIQVI